MTEAKNIYVAGARSLHKQESSTVFPSNWSPAVAHCILRLPDSLQTCLRPVFAPHVQSSEYQGSRPTISSLMPRPMPKLFMLTVVVLLGVHLIKPDE